MAANAGFSYYHDATMDAIDPWQTSRRVTSSIVVGCGGTAPPSDYEIEFPRLSFRSRFSPPDSRIPSEPAISSDSEMEEYIDDGFGAGEVGYEDEDSDEDIELTEVKEFNSRSDYRSHNSNNPFSILSSEEA